MSFLRQSTKVNERHKAEEATRDSGRTDWGDTVSTVWLKKGEWITMRFLDQEEVVDEDGLITQLGNPAKIGKTSLWKGGKPEASYLNPATFGEEDALSDKRREWFREQKKLLPSGEKVDAKLCPFPGCQDRFLIWGLITDVSWEVAEDARFQPRGIKIFEMGKDSWDGLLNCLRTNAMRCEFCSRSLKFNHVACPSCEGVLIGDEDCSKIEAEVLLEASENGLAGMGVDTCIHCGYDLNNPVTVAKKCSNAKCKEKGDREGYSPASVNIKITRTGDRTYSFDLDLDWAGPLDQFPDELLDMIDREVKLTYDPVTGETASNVYGLRGATAEVIAGLGQTARAIRAKSPLRNRA